jgi:hypothetical protein
MGETSLARPSCNDESELSETQNRNGAFSTTSLVTPLPPSPYPGKPLQPSTEISFQGSSTDELALASSNRLARRMLCEIDRPSVNRAVDVMVIKNKF